MKTYTQKDLEDLLEAVKANEGQQQKKTKKKPSVGSTIRQKLSSRKFWTMLGGVVTSLLILFKTDQETILEVTSLITGVGAMVAWLMVEGYVDGKRIESEGNTGNDEE